MNVAQAQASFRGAPIGWRTLKLGDALPLEYGKALPERARQAGGVAVYGSAGVVGSHSTALVEAPAVIVGRKGSAGSVHFSEGPSWPIDTVYFTTGSDDADVRYGFYLLQHLRLAQFDQSTAVPSLSRDVYSEIEASFPSLAQQRLIADRIDELLGEVEAGEQELASAKADLARYRRAVLKAAVTGELTRDWRGAKVTNAKGDITDLPVGWRWARVGDIGRVQLGRQRAPTHHTGPNMRPYLRVANVFEDRIDVADVMEMNFDDRDYRAYKLEIGDILLNEGQSLELVGRPAIFRGELEDVCFTNTLVRYQCGSGLLNDFALIVFRSWMRDGTFQRIAKITTNIAHLGAGRFADLLLPLPSLTEQRRIVDLTRKMLDAITEQERAIDDATRTVMRLRQSVLAAAFAGRLTSKNPARMSPRAA